MRADRWLPWAVRGAWGLLPLVCGGALAEWAGRLDDPARVTAASGLLWLGWAVVALATAAPLPVGLTVLRLGTAAGVAVCAATASPTVAFAIAALALSFRHEIAEWYVNGPAYPNERRFPLAVPTAVVLGPLWLAGAAAVVLPAASVLAFAGRAWGWGAALAVVGTPAAFVGARALHGLSRRWLVFVPAGVVLHDPLSIVDPVLFPRAMIESLRAAPADSDSLDLTLGSRGLALELVLNEKVPMVRRSRGGGETGASARLLFTPTRPGRVLREAERRRVPIGA
ncbi:MAG TPA: hypothetical protein VNB24_00220 [Acidimicrobiales bacterium]|nr:hypothetical protein [Acidimicrobiales bacterium]